jgi:hypothetical protein
MGLHLFILSQSEDKSSVITRNLDLMIRVISNQSQIQKRSNNRRNILNLKLSLSFSSIIYDKYTYNRPNQSLRAIQ